MPALFDRARSHLARHYRRMKQPERASEILAEGWVPCDGSIDWSLMQMIYDADATARTPFRVRIPPSRTAIADSVPTADHARAPRRKRRPKTITS